MTDGPVLRPDYPVRTERLRLRPLTGDDLDALVSYRSLPEVCRYVPFHPMDEARVQRYLATDWAVTELTGEGQSLTLGVELAATGRLLGDVILFWHSAEHRGGEIGYVFHPDAAGHGYATEAADALLRLAFEGLGLRRVVARIDERNDASANVARRLGMRLEAHLVENEYFKGEWVGEFGFAILDREWRARHDAT